MTPHSSEASPRLCEFPAGGDVRTVQTLRVGCGVCTERVLVRGAGLASGGRPALRGSDASRRVDLGDICVCGRRGFGRHTQHAVPGCPPCNLMFSHAAS